MSREDWSASDIAEYREYLDDFIGAIKDGIYDDKLAEIAKACFVRRDELKPELRAAYASKAPAALSNVQFLGENGHVLRPVKHSSGTVSYNDCRYSKTDMVGQYLKLQAGTGVPFYVIGIPMKVVGVGINKVMLVFEEDPQDTYPTSEVLKKKNICKGTPYNVKIDQIAHIFG